MLGPKNTAADVADILIAGLMNGSISLDGLTVPQPETPDELRRRQAMEYMNLAMSHVRKMTKTHKDL